VFDTVVRVGGICKLVDGFVVHRHRALGTQQVDPCGCA
jgi:hypothetical protein